MMINAQILFIYIKYIWFVKEQLVINNFDTSESSFLSTHLNGFKYFYVTLSILFNISNFLAQLNVYAYMIMKWIVNS